MTFPRLSALYGAALFCLLPSLARAEAPAAGFVPATGFLDRTIKDADGKEAKYVLFVPDGYKADGSKAYPVILFLHGSGETGDEGKKQAGTGLGPAIRNQEKDGKHFPFFAVFPQSQERNWKADSKDGQRAVAILDAVEKDYKIDEKRQYLTGLSMGGFGTWSLAEKYPDRWAAIVPVCGGGNPADVKAIKDIPCWVFHGDADKAVNVEKGRQMVAALKEAGAKPKFTEYPGVGHNSWDKAYATPELYEWLLEQHK
jgi:predicted peptidase